MRNLLSNKKLLQEGFTLLELIVVFTVIAILSTAGLASFVNYSKTETLKQAQNDLINTLNTAKSDAFSQIKPTQCASYTLQGYSVTINASTWKTYYLNALCSGFTFQLSKTDLPTGVSFNSGSQSPPTTTTSVVFSLLTGGVVGAGNIVLSGNNNTKTVTVTSVGGIQ